MEEQHSGKIIAHVDNDLADLIPGYLTNRKKDKDTIRAKPEDYGPYYNTTAALLS